MTPGRDGDRDSVHIGKVIVSIAKPAVVQAIVARAWSHADQKSRKLAVIPRDSEVTRVRGKPVHLLNIYRTNVRHFRLVKREHLRQIGRRNVCDLNLHAGILD